MISIPVSGGGTKNKTLPGYYNGQAKMDGFTTVSAAASWMVITKISEYHDHLLTHLQRLEQKRLEISKAWGLGRRVPRWVPSMKAS